MILYLPTRFAERPGAPALRRLIVNQAYTCHAPRRERTQHHLETQAAINTSSIHSIANLCSQYAAQLYIETLYNVTPLHSCHKSHLESASRNNQLQPRCFLNDLTTDPLGHIFHAIATSTWRCGTRTLSP
jgi:hypothetical protein